jgi:methyl-accepting chemotaxis protein
MKFLHNTKLAYRFALIILCVIIGFAIYGIWSFRTLNELKINGVTYQRIAQGKDLVADILPPPEYIIESYLVSLQLASSDKGEQPALIVRLKALKAEYDSRHTFWEKENLSRELGDVLLKDAHTPALTFYGIVFNELIPALESDNKERAATAITGMKSAYEIHRKAIDQLVQLANNRVTLDEKNAEAQIHTATILLLAVLFITIASTVVIAMLISRSVTVPLHTMQRTMQEIQHHNDFTRRLNADSDDEIGQTCVIFNEMINGLQSSLLSISSNAHELTSAASELSVSSRQVASSSAEQSSAASSMAATVEQVTVGIAHIANGAHEAQGISVKSGELSAQGGEIIQNAATAMMQIAESIHQTSQSIQELGIHSSKISSVVQVIKEVAEQTNLLALNAAIEAARAGEMGRGFAVVADEVRKLAERTSSATQEISSMIANMQSSSNQAMDTMNAAVVKADSGAILAREAGDAINQIKEGSAKVVTVVNDISTSLNEQNTASQDIAAHVEQVAQMAEENTAAANQTAQSAFQLEKLASDMHTTVGKFRL